MLQQSEKSRLKRAAQRGSYDRAVLYPIIDDLKMAHISFQHDGQVMSIPMLCWRVEDDLFIHGSRGSRLIKQLSNGQTCCLSFAELNAWVMAKSGFHHSANYRSAVLFGCFEEVSGESEQMDAYEDFIEQLEEGRWQHIRQPNEKELKATSLLKMTIAEGSVKIRSGGPNDDPEDMQLSVWTGEIPLIKHWGDKVHS